MRHNPYAFARFLLNLSEITRVSIVLLSMLLSLLVFMAIPIAGIDRNPMIFVIPVALSSWLFQRWGLLICLLCLFVATFFYFAITTDSLALPPTVMFYFILSGITLIIIGGFICSQRDSLDFSEEVQLRMELVNKEQQNLSDIKDQFLQNVNHELRTPLTAIYGYLELLLEQQHRLDDEMRETFLQNAMQSCDELQLLVNNVLDTMGLEKERQSLFTEQLVVRDILYEVLERFDPKSLLAHSIVVHIPDYIVVLANAQYLRQVFRNLLSNAFKYAPGGTEIVVRARLHGDTVDPLHAMPEICISVKDSGPGIPKNEITQLFGQFVRLRRDTTGRIRGSGLGLFLNKQFVEAMDGRIWVESDGIPGHGSCFYFTLPCVVHPKVLARTSLADFAQFKTPVSID